MSVQVCALSDLAPGTAADPVLFQFVSDIENEQSGEIKRMDKVLAALSKDPRTGLAAGFDNAGEAIMGMTKIATLSKPAGFFNPENPLGRVLPSYFDEAHWSDETGVTDPHSTEHQVRLACTRLEAVTFTSTRRYGRLASGGMMNPAVCHSSSARVRRRAMRPSSSFNTCSPVRWLSGRATTTATTISPQRASGRPITEASAMSGLSISRFSISAG